jgi:hypothetical protein
VEGQRDYGPKSNLPERITVRCYKSEREVVARFHVLPKERASRGLMRVVRLDDYKTQAGGKKRRAEVKEPWKPGPRS